MTYHDPIDTAFAIAIVAFALLAVFCAAVAITRAIDRSARAEGFKEGVTAERLRWHEAEMRIGHEMIARAMRDDDFTETEIDA